MGWGQLNLQTAVTSSAGTAFTLLFLPADEPTTPESCDGLYLLRGDPAHRGIGGRLLALIEQRVHEAGGRRLYIETSGRELCRPTQGFDLHQRYELASCLDF